MLKRGTIGKNAYSPYATGQRVKKAESKGKLDILPNKHNIWLKQVRFPLRVNYLYHVLFITPQVTPCPLKRYAQMTVRLTRVNV